jgi:alpha-aminoadipic semialdehyde synthase
MQPIGIREEDKSPFERRVPLVPDDLDALSREAGIRFRIQRSDRRAFGDSEFEGLRGTELVQRLEGCPVVLGVKEIPVERLVPETTYLFFSHTVKGQAYNMPMLRRLAELRCTLIDYERIVDDDGRRLVAFGAHAGMAGAIDTVWSLGQRWAALGRPTPLAGLQPAHRYRDRAAAEAALSRAAEACRSDPAFRARDPVVIGVTGGGRVAGGANQVLDALDPVEASPESLATASAPGRFVRVRFDERHFAEPLDGAPFELQRYYDAPEAHRAIFEERYLRKLTVLLNGIYWEPRYPRLLTKEGAKDPGRLVVVGDVSCDIEGSVEITVRPTDPGAPTYVYDPRRGVETPGFEGPGLSVMAVDILPTELPRDASLAFSQALRPFVEALAGHDFASGLEGLPAPLRRAAILDRGRLTEAYAYLRTHLSTA